MSKVDLSIIIVSFNTRDILKNCLDTIFKFTKNLVFEIIVVENGSKDGSLEMLKEYQKKSKVIKIIDLELNVGFGRGCNLGAKSSSGEYLLFLNSDTELISNSLKETYLRASNLKDCGVYSCQLLNKDSSVQESGGYFPTLFNLASWQLFIDDLPLVGSWINSIHPHKTGFNFLHRLFEFKNKGNGLEPENFKPDWVTGAFMVIPRNIFLKAGQFDENIFVYTEEMELTYRIAKMGYKTYYEPMAKIVHLGGSSGGSYLAITSEVKYMIYFWEKHMPHWQVPIVKILFYIGSLLRLILFGIIKKDEKYRQAYSDALKICF